MKKNYKIQSIEKINIQITNKTTPRLQIGSEKFLMMRPPAGLEVIFINIMTKIDLELVL